MDEVQTGVGATGVMWAHERFNLQPPPDLVTFSKKFQSAGYFFPRPRNHSKLCLQTIQHLVW